jgi:hypothetical protein
LTDALIASGNSLVNQSRRASAVTLARGRSTKGGKRRFDEPEISRTDQD